MSNNTRKVNELTLIGDIADGDVLVGERTNGTTVRVTYAAPTGVSDGDKGDITVASSGTVWTIDTPSVATVATNDKVLIKDTDASDVMKYVTAQSIADLASGGVSSVNTETGDVVLTTDDISDSGQTSKYTSASDITKLANIEALADVTDEANVTDALDGATLVAATLATDDKVLIQDTDGSDVLKTVTAQAIADLNPTLTQEQVEDYAGAVVATGGTKTGITVTYQDSTNDMDFVVADTTVAGDSGSTGITPGDTLTIAGGTNVTTAMSGDTLTVNVDDAFLSNSGDTGTGAYDFGGADSLEIPNGTAPTVNADGEIAIDTSVSDFSTGVMKIYGGEEQGVVSMPIAQFTSPTDGYVVKYNGTNDEFELGAGGGSPGGSDTQVQYNNSGSFGGISGATTNGAALTLVAPVLGTPASGTLTNCTGLPVAGGGTGISTTTAYSVICAGTTSTGAFQSLAALGNAGAKLTSAGAGALPSMKGGNTAFKAYRTSNQSINSTTSTKMQLNIEGFDTGGMYDNATNYRFTPTIAGKYLFSCTVVMLNIADGKRVAALIYKNGAVAGDAEGYSAAAASTVGLTSVTMVDMNGSTDYVEFYAYHEDASTQSLWGVEGFTGASGVLMEPA